MEIRPWKPGDEIAIRALFEAVFGSAMSESFWKWRYHDHPAGPPMIMLAWEGDRLAAHYAASYAPLLIDGEPQLSALSMTTMTHADFRGQGLLERTGLALYEEQRQRGLIGCWGFPNRNVNVTRRRKLGWEGIADIPTLQRPISPGEKFASVAVSLSDRIPAQYDSLARAAAPVRADRARAFHAWRTDDNPQSRYTHLTPEDGSGYAVIKPWKDGAYDLVLLEAADPGSLARLTEACLAAVQALGGKLLNAWSLAHRPERVALERAGFLPLGMVTNFGGRSFPAGDRRLTTAQSWKLDMIDSDLY
ncbi:GNAT family N-acetyltransferase [Pseudogemmobacter faecipullorum]|uniref:GNAT family N-acetyltransferase n=1 Tax=Pseudogemmobacter faecipullorum TaxID=2755041 RepID=A0ABS8CGD8_9RHOB|nr:GNAT family N-acetyltransferase [Pseudogemmobacter faecipullorum]MCB5408452.1 GNAT family N-acetyltransferase [Pseudogemmobacter faecipullorum]